MDDEDDNDDDIIDDMDEVERDTTAIGGIINNEDVQLEIDDGDDDIADDDPALPMNTNYDVVPDSPGMTRGEKDEDDAKDNDNAYDKNDFGLEQVTMVPPRGPDGSVENERHRDGHWKRNLMKLEHQQLLETNNM